MSKPRQGVSRPLDRQPKENDIQTDLLLQQGYFKWFSICGHGLIRP